MTEGKKCVFTLSSQPDVYSVYIVVMVYVVFYIIVHGMLPDSRVLITFVQENFVPISNIFNWISLFFS